MNKKSGLTVLWWAALGAALAVALGVSLAVGPVQASPAEVWAFVFGGSVSGGDDVAAALMSLRFPRVVLSALVGAALSLAGVVMQAVFRNPLVEPGLVGASSGAGVGAVAMLVFAPSLLPGFGAYTVELTSAAAFVGSLLAVALVWGITSASKGVDKTSALLLAGIAVNALAGAAIGLITFVANDAQLRSLTFWTMGSMAGADWRTAMLLACLLAVLFAIFRLGARAMDTVALGVREAGHLGYDVPRLHRLWVVLSSLLVGVCVATCGGIAFVGLIVPHTVRMIFGARHASVLPASLLAGAILLACADTLCRTVVPPSELPLGTITALLGGPFFLYLLLRSQRRAG